MPSLLGSILDVCTGIIEVIGEFTLLSGFEDCLYDRLDIVEHVALLFTDVKNELNASLDIVKPVGALEYDVVVRC